MNRPEGRKQTRYLFLPKCHFCHSLSTDALIGRTAKFGGGMDVFCACGVLSRRKSRELVVFRCVVLLSARGQRVPQPTSEHGDKSPTTRCMYRNDLFPATFAAFTTIPTFTVGGVGHGGYDIRRQRDDTSPTDDMGHRRQQHRHRLLDYLRAGLSR